MEPSTSNIGTQNMGVKLSTLWIFVMFNYLYCDIVSLMDPMLLKQYLAGNVEGLEFTPAFLLGAAALMEIPISMIVISRLAKPQTSRWLNIVAGVIMTLVQASTLLIGTPAMYYAFFSAIEIACTSMIVWYAWKWR